MGFSDANSGQAEILVIGDEVISGFIVDTNSKYLGQRIFELGMRVSRITKIGDDFLAIQECVVNALDRSDWIILTGGLGATHDDITKSVVMKVFGSNFRRDEKVATMLKKKFQRRNRDIPKSVESQCKVPDNCQVLYNEIGTAPGFRFEKMEHVLFCLPGVPYEMKHLFEQFIAPELKKHSAQVFSQRILKTIGVSEADLWGQVGSIAQLQKKVNIASLPSHLGVRIRLSCSEEKKEIAEAFIDQAEQELMKKIGQFVYGRNEELLEEKVGQLLIDKSMTLATAESCTGGLIGHRITQISGSSKYFKEGFVVYSNHAKVSRLGIDQKTLEKYGAVSEPVARLMAEGVCRVSGTDIGVSVTGIAGPTGGSEGKPVGLTFIAVSDAAGTWCGKYIYTHDRIKNKERVAQTALNLVRMKLLGLLKEEN